MKQFQVFFICLLSLPSVTLAQTDERTITLFSEILTSPSLSAYVRTLTETLDENGFRVEVNDNDEPFLVGPGQIRTVLQGTGGALGLAYLQTQFDEGDDATALLLAPGAFTNFNEQRAALQGVIGDAARDEINDENLLALRLWPHSTDALVSTTQLDFIDDFRDTNIITRNPYSIAFFENLNASPMEVLSFDELKDALTADDARNAAIVPQSNILDLLTDGGTVIPEYMIRTAVTLTSPNWWRSLTAREQRLLLEALDTAEVAAAESVQEATDQAIEMLGDRQVSWQDFNAAEIRRAVSASIFENVSVDAEPILQLRDDIKELQPRSDQDTDTNEPEQNGSLNQPARVFFASNRHFHPNESRFVDRFANWQDKKNKLRCGEIKPPGAHQVVGKVSGEVTLVLGSTVTESSDACIELISSAAHAAGGKVLIQVHGYNNTFDNAIRTGLAFSRDAESEGVVVIWSWPSAGGSRSYSADEEMVSIIEPDFNEFSISLSQSTGVDHVDFLAHSMGSRLVANLMRDMWIDQPSAVVLAAADVSRRYLTNAVEAAQSASVTLLATEGDRALLASREIHGRDRAGLAEPLFLMVGMDTIDLTAFDRFLWKLERCTRTRIPKPKLNFNHRHAFTVREVVADLRRLFGGNWTAMSRGLKPFPSPESSIDHYRIIPADR